MPHYFERPKNGRFGFHALIDPPRTDPGLQALSHRNAAEQPTKERQIVAQRLNERQVERSPVIKHPISATSSSVTNPSRQLPRPFLASQPRYRVTSGSAFVKGNKEDSSTTSDEAGDEGSGNEGGEEGCRDENDSERDDEHRTRRNPGLWYQYMIDFF